MRTVSEEKMSRFEISANAPSLLKALSDAHTIPGEVSEFMTRSTGM